MILNIKNDSNFLFQPQEPWFFTWKEFLSISMLFSTFLSPFHSLCRIFMPCHFSITRFFSLSLLFTIHISDLCHLEFVLLRFPCPHLLSLSNYFSSSTFLWSAQESRYDWPGDYSFLARSWAPTSLTILSLWRGLLLDLDPYSILLFYWPLQSNFSSRFKVLWFDWEECKFIIVWFCFDPMHLACPSTFSCYQFQELW